MHERCRVCGYRFEREQGYFVGAMYINYGVTVLIIVAGYFALEWWTHITLAQQLALWCGVGILLPPGLLPASAWIVVGIRLHLQSRRG